MKVSPDNRLVAIYSDKGYFYRWTEERSFAAKKFGLNMFVFALLQEGGMTAEVAGEANPAEQEDSARPGMGPGGTISEIEVRTNYDDENIHLLIEVFSGLKVGDNFSRDDAREVKRRLWRGGQLFRDVTVNHAVLDTGIKVILDVEVLPGTDTITMEGFDEVKEEEVLSLTGLVRGLPIGPRQINRWKPQILALYHERGILSAEVEFTVTPVPGNEHKVDVNIAVIENL